MRQICRCLSTVVFLLGLGLVPGVPRVASAQAVGDPRDASTSSLDKIQLDVSAQAFLQKLPFDVPFFIVGAPPKLTTTIHAHIVESGVADKVCAVPYVREVRVGEDATAFELYVERRLCADRRYEVRLTFLKRPELREIERIRNAAMLRFDTVLRSVIEGDIPEASARGIHDELVEEVRQAAGPGNWRSTPDGLFDISGNRRPLERLLIATRRVIAAQLSRKEIFIGHKEVQAFLTEDLRALANSPALVALKRIPEELREDPDVVPVWERNKSGIDLLNASTPQLDLLALGGSDVPSEDIWTDYSAKITSYGETLNALRALDTIIRAATDERQLRGTFQPVLGDQNLAALEALITSAGRLTRAIERTGRLQRELTRLQAGLKTRTEALQALAQQIDLLVVQELFVIGSTIADGNTPENPYISMDGGFLYAPRIKTGALYVGTNIYTRPINKNAPLSEAGGFRRRFAFTVGLTLASIKDEAERTRFDFMSDSRSLVVGAGFRISPSMRIGAGALVFREGDPNPNVTSRNTTATWYLTISADLNIASTLGGKGGPFANK
jgi:hypothetical protein